MLDPSRRLEVPGFPQASVYRDHQQAQTYYVVPWSAGIAIDANGRPECRLLLFVKRGPAGSIATGGQLSLTATLSIAAGDLARIKQSIESSLTPAAVAGEPPPRPVVVQLATPDEMRGRVGAVNFLFINASNQLGQFESGVAAALLGAMPAAVLGGVCTVAVALLWMKLFPALRQVESLE